MKQLDLFTEIIEDKNESKNIRNEWDKTRKALFMQNAELKKMYQEVAHELQILKLNICRGRIAI